MRMKSFDASFLEQVKNIIVTDKELVELRERFEAALTEEISTWVSEDFAKIQRCILDKAAKREFSIEEKGVRIAGEFLLSFEWRSVCTASLRTLHDKMQKRGVLQAYYDLDFFAADSFAMRLRLAQVKFSEEANSPVYRICATTAKNYITQLLELAHRNGVQLFCHDVPICVEEPMRELGTASDNTLRFSYSVTV